ncbi:MAG: 2-methylcitrate synthase, partial [Achromobacter mucicolens]
MSTAPKKQEAKSDAKPEEKAGFKPKKSVALSGVVVGDSRLCTVGRAGNDLHYRGYDILDIADVCQFE